MVNKKNAQTIATLFLSLFIIAGIGMLIGAGISYYKTTHLIEVGLQNEGIIVDLRYHTKVKKRRRSRTYQYIIAFTTNRGEKITFSQPMQTGCKILRVGDKVGIIYEPSNPHYASVNQYWFLWGPTCGLGAGGGMFILIPLIMLYGMKRSMR